jgi:hypothetical protein
MALGCYESGEVDRKMWRIDINGQGLEVTKALRGLVERDLRAALKPHSGRVTLAHVRLWESVEDDGPTTCYIRVDLRPSGGVALGATAPDLAKAVRLASDRVGTAVENQLARAAGASNHGAHSWFRT